MATVKPAEPGDPAVWTMTVTVESVPPDRHFEVADHLRRPLSDAHEALRCAGLGRVRESAVYGPGAVGPT